MNILLVSSKYPPEYSGSGHRAHWLYRRLISAHPDWTVQVLAGAEQHNDSVAYKHEGLPVQRIAGKPCPERVGGWRQYVTNARNFGAEYHAARRWLENRPRPDLLHIFGESYVTVAALDFATRHRLPVMLELCNEMDSPWQYVPFPHSLRVRGRLRDRYLLVCISERLAAMCRRNGIPEERIWCRPNPVDEARFHPVDEAEKARLRRELTPFGPEDRLLVYVANFRPSKNHLLLIEALRHLPSEYKLWLAGPVVEHGPGAAAAAKLLVQIQAAAAELPGRVAVTPGFRDDVHHCLQMADVYPFPSLSEGLGTPMLEAIACGVPVVASRLPGVTDAWIHDGENGFLADPDPEAFAGRIRQAVALSRDQRLRAAAAMTAAAGTLALDAQYGERISALAMPT
jgi:glycosyltransferase involved in cell wall biosynthesis